MEAVSPVGSGAGGSLHLSPAPLEVVNGAARPPRLLSGGLSRAGLRAGRASGETGAEPAPGRRRRDSPAALPFAPYSPQGKMGRSACRRKLLILLEPTIGIEPMTC